MPPTVDEVECRDELEGPGPHQQRIWRHLRQGRPRSRAAFRYPPPVEDYTNKYKGEQVEVALFGGDYQEGVLTAYCSFEDVPHVELNGHILIPLQNVASLHCSSRCDAPEPDWPPRGFIEDDAGDP
jgi:hypothetical protein